MKTILITGAGGFFGRNAARYFGNQGYSVVGVGRTPTDQHFRTSWKISDWVTRDLASSWELPTQLEPDAIVHCAGSSDVGRSATHPNEDFIDSVLSLQTTLEYCRRLENASKIIYLSSAAVYGTARNLPIQETDCVAPISVYGVHKSICEQLVRSYAAHFGVSSSIIRFFSIYGPGLRKQILWDASRKAMTKDGRFFGTGLETRDFLHIEDAVRLIDVALNNTSADCPVINGGSGEGTTISHLVSSIFRALDAKIEPVFAQTERTGDPKDYLADITKATDWGWSPKHSLDDGISEYVHWIRSLPASEIAGN